MSNMICGSNISYKASKLQRLRTRLDKKRQKQTKNRFTDLYTGMSIGFAK
jgi:hypothetical protein